MRHFYTLVLLALSTAAVSQRSIPVYTITADPSGPASWTRLQLMDLRTGNAIGSSLQGSAQFLKTAAASDAGMQLLAACALDKQRQRLYFAPMKQNQLRYIDLGDAATGMKVIGGQELVAGADMNDIGNQVTRMTIDAKGNGYALTNNSKHLVRFNTNGELQIQDLGALVNNPGNDVYSVHDRCISWGGDICADDNGDLYLVTSNRAVFFIDIKTRVATFRGLINGLPKNYTTNGVAADDQGRMVVGSSNSKEGYFLVDLEDLQARRIDAGNAVLSVADMASGHVLYQKPVAWNKQTLTEQLVRNEAIHVYPNPVTNGNFRVTFSELPAGKYELQLFDWNGKIVAQQSVLLTRGRQTEQVIADGSLAKGVYLLKITGNNSRTVYSDKLMVQ